MSLFEKIQSDPPSWAGEKIASWEDVFTDEMANFVVRETVERGAYVDMRDVIGQSGHYEGQTWLEAAVSPRYKPSKMTRAFAMYEKNPDYYFNGQLVGDDCIVLSSLNGSGWYTDSGGNHRTVVAKFACDSLFRDAKVKGEYPRIHGALTRKYEVDLESKALYGELLKFAGKGISILLEHSESSKTTSVGVTVTAYETTFQVSDFRFNSAGRSQKLGAAQFRKFARHLLASDGKVSGWDRLRHLWKGAVRGEFDGLIYPE
ncbi:hypothetical protein F4827_006609 [Paraburkholderia bannensis]|uniref:Uncharacterized protein n=1 Tax=Paraburkholderia bannensis TaxID=765414 RepID=A0A7W9U4B8_9BURK|nr:MULTISPECIES: hypothetical protein [Paraburkholderia]MBB3261767.1 hypothetical protein [Paraburkholderia sp. WP4_3_2]MBB6106733.1 hypothetical protein [Paraburkholderia bannensis]